MEKLLHLLMSMPFVMALPVIGYIISKWLNQEPKGLVKYDVLSAQVSQNPSWHLPIVVIGYLLSFLINMVVYSIYAITYLLEIITRLAKWIYNNVLIYIWEIIVYLCTMAWDVFKMLIHIFIFYFIKTPTKIFITVINSIRSTLNWKSYLSSYKTFAIGSTIAGLTIFIGYLTNQEKIGRAHV